MPDANGNLTPEEWALIFGPNGELAQGFYGESPSWYSPQAVAWHDAFANSLVNTARTPLGYGLSDAWPNTLGNFNRGSGSTSFLDPWNEGWGWSGGGGIGTPMGGGNEWASTGNGWQDLIDILSRGGQTIYDIAGGRNSRVTPNGVGGGAGGEIYGSGSGSGGGGVFSTGNPTVDMGLGALLDYGLGRLFGGGSTNNLKPMFASQKAAKGLIKGIYGKGSKRAIRDFLQNPIPVTGGELAEANYFGTAPDADLQAILSNPNSKQRNKLLREYAANYDPAAAAERAAQSPFNQRLGGTIGRIEENLLPTVDQLLGTGLRTSIDPLIAEETRRLTQETAPALAARYRTSLRSSGFDNATAQALEDLAVRLGTLNFNADEAAANRRSQAALGGGAAAAYQLPLNLELGGALVTGSAGERARGRFESVRPGSRLLSALPGLAQVEQGGGFIQEGYRPGGNGLADLAAILAGTNATATGDTGTNSGSDIGAIYNIFGNGGLNNTAYDLPATGGPYDPFANRGIV